MDIITQNEKETAEIGKSLANQLAPGTILALFGDLGSGKTTFVKGLASGLGIEKHVTSPTFNIVKVYPVSSGRIKRLVHVDAYRLNSDKDAESVGLLEILADPDTLTVIEWPEKIMELIEEKIKEIHFTFIDEMKRKISS